MIINALLKLEEDGRSVAVLHFTETRPEGSGGDDHNSLTLCVNDSSHSAMFHFDSPAEFTAFARRMLRTAEQHEDGQS